MVEAHLLGIDGEAGRSHDELSGVELRRRAREQYQMQRRRQVEQRLDEGDGWGVEQVAIVDCDHGRPGQMLEAEGDVAHALLIGFFTGGGEGERGGEFGHERQQRLEEMPEKNLWRAVAGLKREPEAGRSFVGGQQRQPADPFGAERRLAEACGGDDLDQAQGSPSCELIEQTPAHDVAGRECGNEMAHEGPR
ncbi:MAG: hypothetical protein NTZ50_06925 [Chloroflexi bacterium]|nr:hypothetical protein [Chloroflexota bacterium]